jgi:hypothetical protein
MAELNTIYYNDPNRQLYINNDTNEFIVSGYRLVVDNNLNRDLLLVTPPPSPLSAGKKGNIAFDKNYVYYCLENNTWARSALAAWDTIRPEGFVTELDNGNTVRLPTPSHWWPLTQDSNSKLGDYNFIQYGAVSYSSGGAETSNTRTFKVGSFGNSLLNYSSNLIEPSTLNQSFSISFETKRLINLTPANQFILGNAFGKLGFYFEYANQNGTATGNYLTFAFSTHQAPSYSWTKIRTTGQVLDAHYHQVVVANDAYNSGLFLYLDGALQASGRYATRPGSYYNNPSFQGFGIGANPNGSSNTPVNSVEYNTPVVIKNLHFWKGIAITSGNAKALYNGGAFKSYPFN